MILLVHWICVAATQKAASRHLMPQYWRVERQTDRELADGLAPLEHANQKPQDLAKEKERHQTASCHWSAIGWPELNYKANFAFSFHQNIARSQLEFITGADLIVVVGVVAVVVAVGVVVVILPSLPIACCSIGLHWRQ